MMEKLPPRSLVLIKTNSKNQGNKIHLCRTITAPGALQGSSMGRGALRGVYSINYEGYEGMVAAGKRILPPLQYGLFHQDIIALSTWCILAWGKESEAGDPSVSDFL